VRDHCRNNITPIRLHRRINQHLEEQVALSIAAAEQTDLILPRR